MMKKILLITLLFSYIFAGSYDNGIKFYKQGLYKKALQSFKIAVNNDDNKAMLAIGIMYANGDGVAQNSDLSFEWFLKSAKAGNTYAFSKLGNIYASKKDFKNAFKWFLKSANKNDSKSAYHLGYFYTGGLGVKRDLKKALSWYEKSAKAGNIDAQLNLGFMYIAGHGTKVDLKKASYWIQKAKNTGNQKSIVLWKEFKLDEYAK
jgi:TPR repeat protein